MSQLASLHTDKSSNESRGRGLAYSLELSGSRGAAPEEAHDAESTTQHVAQHGREAAVGGEVGKEVWGLPVRQSCMQGSVSKDCEIISACSVLSMLMSISAKAAGT